MSALPDLHPIANFKQAIEQHTAQIRTVVAPSEFVRPVWRWVPRFPPEFNGPRPFPDQRHIAARSGPSWEEPEVDADEGDFE